MRRTAAPAPLPSAVLLAGAVLIAAPVGVRAQSPAAGAGVPGAAGIFRMERLADGVWAALVLARPDAYAFANSLVVMGEGGVLVVDTQQSATAARALIRWIRHRTDAPVRWVVNTHWHGDHVYGNQAYRQAFPGVRFVAHGAMAGVLERRGREAVDEALEAIPARMAERRRALDTGRTPEGRHLDEDQRRTLRHSLRVNEAYLRDLRTLELVPPDIEVHDRWETEVGSRRVRVLAVEPAHTATDVVVQLPDDGIVAPGDLVEEGVPWFGDARPRGWARALNRLDAAEPRIVVPGHGGVQRGDGLLGLERRFLAALVERVGAAASDGMGLQETKAAVSMDDFRQAFVADLGVGAGAYREGVGTAVERAWLEIRGEPSPEEGAPGIDGSP